MLDIALVCNWGASTTMIANKIKQAADNRNIEAKVTAYSYDDIKDVLFHFRIVPADPTELIDSYSDPRNKIVKTGEDGCINNIYGFAGNVSEWTQERTSDLLYTVRGGRYDSFYNSVDLHCVSNPERLNKGIGFRTTLYID